MKSLLLIDDNDEIRMVLAETLAQSGFSVRAARDGRQGIQMVLAQKPDLIICDVNMPSMDGFRTVEALRKVRSTAGIPVILMTGNAGQDAFRRGMACGADEYLLKPFTPSELINAVESRLLQQERLEQAASSRAWKLDADSFREFSHEHDMPFRESLTPVSAFVNERPTIVARPQ